MRALQSVGFRLLLHAGSLTPLALLIWDSSQDQLSANPIEAATLRTGKTALVLLLLSLACTPASRVFGFKPAQGVRRALGLYAFLYASIHLWIFVGVDYGLDADLLREAVLEKRYALAGLATYLLLLPIALTSTGGWRHRLGSRWKRLHRAAYAAALVAVVHYLWGVKADVTPPLAFGVAVIVLLLLRLPAVTGAGGKAREILRTVFRPASSRA